MNLPNKSQLQLCVNDEEVQVLAYPGRTLLQVLREDLLLTGTKHGCELGECGACTVLLDGQPVMSCLVLAHECEGADIETVEGLANGEQLHPLQLSFAELGGTQCGYCTPGMLMTAKALVESDNKPNRSEIREALSGNLCRCTGYQQIIESVETAVLAIHGSDSEPGSAES